MQVQPEPIIKENKYSFLLYTYFLFLYEKNGKYKSLM